jgi:hypothetical protein
MTTMHRALLPTLAALLSAGTLAAQTTIAAAVTEPAVPVTATEDTVKPEAEIEGRASLFREVTMQYFTPQDQRGINTFESPKEAGAPFTGFRLDWGAAFTQQFQSLDHSNTAEPRMAVVNGQEVNQNALLPIGTGFNLATANLYLNAQLAPGVRVALESYMSSRGHSEFWVKGGYLQFDQSPIDLAPLHTFMDYATLKVGHFEVNYGDAHFRRTDNGQAMYNPFVGNYILDSFTTEIGAELYLRHRGLMGMVALTSGEIKGAVDNPERRSWARYAKLGFDRQVSDLLRVRLTGSAYRTDKAMNQTLFSGDRAGSRYYEVLVNAVGGNRWSGHIQPGFRNEVTAFQVNPFVKIGGLELFGVIEQAEGRAAAEATTRTWDHYAADAVYRFFDDRLYVGGRYNTASGQLQNVANEVSVDRWQLGGGWFVAPTVLLKAEYVKQQYNDFPNLDIRNGGKFNGLMFEGVISF